MNEEGMNKKQKLIRGIIVGVAVAILGILLICQKGFYVGEKYYIKIGDRFVYNHKLYIERINEEQFDIHAYTGDYSMTIKKEGNHITYLKSNGTIDTTAEKDVVPGNDIYGAIYRIVFDEYETCGTVSYLVFGFIIYMLGLALVVYRKNLVRIFEWRYENAELSYIGDLSVVIASFIIMAIGIAMMSGLYRLVL